MSRNRASLPGGCTNLKLHRVTRAVSRWYEEDMRALGLTAAQYTLLSHVVKLQPVQAAALARWMGMDASTLSRNLKPLVDGGWVVQEAGPDARSRQLLATPAGETLRAQAKEQWRLSQHRVNETLGTQRVMELHRLLDECAELILEKTV